MTAEKITNQKEIKVANKVAQKQRRANVSKKPEEKVKKVNVKKTKKKGNNFWVKDLLLAVINLGFIVAIVFLFPRASCTHRGA